MLTPVGGSGWVLLLFFLLPLALTLLSLLLPLLLPFSLHLLLPLPLWLPFVFVLRRGGRVTCYVYSQWTLRGNSVTN